MDAAREAWTTAIRAIAERQEGSLDLWLGQVECVGMQEGSLLLRVPNKFTRDWISERYLGQILERMRQDVPSVGSVSFLLDSAAFAGKGDDQNRRSRPPSSPSSLRPPARMTVGGVVNPRFTFDEFVEGPCNRLALAACKGLAAAGDASVSPLFIYGPSGVGKTHLLNAIVHALDGATPQGPAVYLPSETFMNDFLDSLKAGKMREFRERYRRICGMLLIDDIQFIASREHTQEEFFHLFNELYNTQRPIVISSDRPPRELMKVEGRLRSRFEWGLMADMRNPQMETRMAIVRKKAAHMGLDLPEDVKEIVASTASSSVRELEGALIRLDVQSSIDDCAITPEMARRALGVMGVVSARQITVEDVIRKVAHSYGLKISDLKGSKRARSISLPRQVAMYLCREVLSMSYPEIGEHLGGRDHTTVINGCKKVTHLLDSDAGLQSSVDSIRRDLQREAA